MITATDLELRAGSRILLSGATLRVQPGDRIGLVGRNGAGKTTTLRVLAGESAPYGGSVDRRGEVGYLPQDPRTGDLHITARDRVLSARGLDTILRDLRAAEKQMASADGDTQERAMRRYARLPDIGGAEWATLTGPNGPAESFGQFRLAGVAARARAAG